MHPAREKMNAALKSVAVPVLRERGFKGSFPHFRRLHSVHVDLVVFQFNKYGGSFVVEIACLTHEQLKSHWNANLSLANATVYDANKRHRLGALSGKDHWFVYGKQNDEPGHQAVEPTEVYEHIASQVASLFQAEGEQWWSGSNPSIERTVVGKPPTAAHVER
jgi:hypothetical protein